MYNPQVTSAVEGLERDFAAQYGFDGAVAVGFGRAALRLALEAVEVRSGDVLVPDFVCAQVPEAVRRAGGTPVYFPIAKDLTAAPDAFRAAITPGTRAAIVVHYFGRPLPTISALAEICREQNIPLIEDCARALGVPSIGAHGDTAIFSFTKSDWCYAGGLLAARSQEWIARARTFRDTSFRAAPGLALRYGLLRRADFIANRPARSRAAEFSGRTLEALSGFRVESFYDAGRFDALMPAFAARRASRVLETLPDVTSRRRKILEEVQGALGPATRLLLRSDDFPQDSYAFLLLNVGGPKPASTPFESGRAHSWRERAAREGITLRHCWPAYQDCEPLQDTPAVRWLAEHLWLMEIHPGLTRTEVQRIARILRGLAAI